MAKPPKVSDDLLKQYMRPWYAAMSVTIYRDIKGMAHELLAFRNGSIPANQARAEAEAAPLTPREAERMREIR